MSSSREWHIKCIERNDARLFSFIPSLQVFKFSVVKHASHVFFHLLQHGEKSKIGQNKTKWCIIREKLTLENSPALQEGVLYSCRAIAVAIPVSMTMKVQVVTLSGSHIMLPFLRKDTQESLEFNRRGAEFQEKDKQECM